MIKQFVIAALALSTTACVNEATQVNSPKTTTDRLGSAVVSPLGDFNIMQTGIPPVLNEAVKNPYLMPPNDSCQGLVDQITLLDKALGPDLDAIVTSEKKSDVEQGGEFAENEAVGSVERTMQGVVPFRSWVRKFSGAEKRSNELKTAVAAGIVRRAFLKGMGQQLGCMPPAAPIKAPLTAAAPAQSPATK